VNITLTQVRGYDADIIGATVTVTDLDTSTVLLSTTWQGNAITLDIEAVTNYKVEVGSVVGYITPSSQQYISKPSRELNITFQYGALGVYIEAIDGTLYTSSSWSSASKTPNSVVLLTDNVKRRIALVQYQAPWLDGDHTELFNVVPASNDLLDAYDRNATLVTWFKNKGFYNSNYAIPLANKYIFPDGVTKGYLPGYLEIQVLYDNKTEINACFTALSSQATPFINTSEAFKAAYWTCEISTAWTFTVWRYSWYCGHEGNDLSHETDNIYIRPIAHYEV